MYDMEDLPDPKQPKEEAPAKEGGDDAEEGGEDDEWRKLEGGLVVALSGEVVERLTE